MRKFISASRIKLILVLFFIYYGQTLFAQNLTAIPGIEAKDISIGKNGTVWIISKSEGIYRWNDTKFEQITGTAKLVSVEPNGYAWVVQANGSTFRYDPNILWKRMDVMSKSIGVGADGSVWRIGTDVSSGGYGIYKLNGSKWEKIPGGAEQVAVDAAGNAWVVQPNGSTFRYNPANTSYANTWVRMDGLSKSIGVGADGSVWRIGMDAMPDGFGIYKWDGGTSWTKIPGGAIRIAGDAAGNIWTVNSSNIVSRMGLKATPPPAATTLPTSTTGKVRLQNTGQYEVKVFRTTANNQKEFITEIAANSDLEVTATEGDRFSVEIINHPTILHRTIYIPVVTKDIPTYFLYGNVAMKDYGGYGINFSTISIDPNLTGVDTVAFNNRNLVTSINKKQIFERLNTTIATDYELGDDNILMKTGFSYSGINQSQNSIKSSLSFGSSNFTNGWSLAISGSIPAGKTVDIGGGFGYSQSQTTQSNSTDIFAFQRFQKLTHQVSVTPSKAYFDPEFIDRIRRLKTATDAINFVKDYGTHYSSVIYYGGDLSSILKMTSREFLEATSKKIDLQLEVSKASPATSTTSGNKTTKSAGGSNGGKLDFSYNESTEERKLLESSDAQYKTNGGGFNSDGIFDADRTNANPLAAILRRIDELITPEVLKYDLDKVHIAKAQQLIKKAIDDYIRNSIASRPIQLPAPEIYEVTLEKMQVTDHMDDLNSNTKGLIKASVYSDAGLRNELPSPVGNLWEMRDYSLDFRFSPNLTKNFTNAKQTFVNYPDPKTGKYKPFYLNVAASVQEKDDIIWAPDGALLKANSGPTELRSLNLQEAGQASLRSFNISSPGNGSIRVYYSIKKMENHFDSPGHLDEIITGTSNPPSGNNTVPSSEVEITMINGGGYVAKFEVNYTVNGYPKSYASGDVLLGWKHKLPIPPNAKNVKIRAWSSWLGWKDAYTSTDTNAVNKCVKLIGVAWEPKWNNQCE